MTRSTRTLATRVHLGCALALLLRGAVALIGAPPGSFGAQAADQDGGVHLISLRQEKSPVHMKHEPGAIAFRVTYLGTLRLGNPQQEFTVMFDTGSGQVVLPSALCESVACQRHARYDKDLSSTSGYVLMSGQPLPLGRKPEQVSIGFGVGKVSGQVVRDVVCLVDTEEKDDHQRPCASMNVVAATELSTNPFSVFPFDGIIGLGLPALSLTREFSYFQALRMAGRLNENMFSIYMAEGGDGSELALGGINPDHLSTPILWTDVALPSQGHWQVEIVGFHVGNFTLDLCRDGGCRGVVDTGTSHIAIPSPHEGDIVDILTLPSDDIDDCRYVDRPKMVIELRDFNLTLYPEDYMRQLPVPNNVQLGAASSSNSKEENSSTEEKPVPSPRSCRARVVGVQMPPEIGLKTFILGQSVLHRYYTVFSYDGPSIGFGLAAGRMERPGEVEDFRLRSASGEHSSLSSEVDGLPATAEEHGTAPEHDAMLEQMLEQEFEPSEAHAAELRHTPEHEVVPASDPERSAGAVGVPLDETQHTEAEQQQVTSVQFA